MSFKDFCNVSNVTFSEKSVTAFRELEDISEFGNVIAVIYAAATFKQIFVDRRYVKVVESITTTDWSEFATAMMNINQFTRNQATVISYNMNQSTKGKEREFWGCMYHALR